VADAHLQQEQNGPEFFTNIDRARAAELGLNADEIATNLNISLSSSEQVDPNFWTDPRSGIPYYLVAQTPEPEVASLNALADMPVSAALSPQGQPVPGLLSNVATLTRTTVPTNTNQEYIQPVYDIYANAQGRDLGSIAGDIDKIVAALRPQLTPGNSIQVLGQIDGMTSAFRDMAIGLAFAAVFVYLLMVVNYQNFGDPVVVILALPMTFCGIVTMLFITGTTLSVPSLMGAIMAVGVASANSILLVTFAREQQLAGMSAFEAAISAGYTRIRPVLMTAAAMIVGMLPMAIGGPGEEQNAAGRFRQSSAICPSRYRALGTVATRERPFCRVWGIAAAAARSGEDRSACAEWRRLAWPTDRLSRLDQTDDNVTQVVWCPWAPHIRVSLVARMGDGEWPRHQNGRRHWLRWPAALCRAE
jgi:multidrug efflux pump subunit AcrB